MDEGARSAHRMPPAFVTPSPQDPPYLAPPVPRPPPRSPFYNRPSTPSFLKPLCVNVPLTLSAGPARSRPGRDLQEGDVGRGAGERCVDGRVHRPTHGPDPTHRPNPSHPRGRSSRPEEVAGLLLAVRGGGGEGFMRWSVCGRWESGGRRGHACGGGGRGGGGGREEE